MKIYLAAAYQRKLEMRGVRSVLQAMGHEITATWIDDENDSDGMSWGQLQLPEDVVRGSAAAQLDLADILRSNMMISFTDAQLARGGRHVEFGVAYAWKKRMVVCGPREHVFHALPFVDHYPDWSALAHDMAFWAVDRRHLLAPKEA